MENTNLGQPRQLYPRIESVPGILHGKPVIQGTRMSVAVLLDHLAGGDTVEELLEDYPFLTREDIAAALAYVARLAATPPSALSETEWAPL